MNDKSKSKFRKEIEAFVVDLQKFVSAEDGQWTVKGFIDIYKNIYTISPDTKIISKIIEIHIFPLILNFGERNNYKIILAEKQNYYPDMTFVHEENENIKFALDIKTTFRRNDKTAGFTLGSHGGYFLERDKDKNIQFPYNQYLAHYCLGVIYSRIEYEKELGEIEVFRAKELEDTANDLNDNYPDRKVTSVDKLSSIASVTKDFQFFVAEKWKIASDSRGSGNTANIGSIKKIDDLINERGVFSKLGEKWFDEYWMNYGKAKMVKKGKTVVITNIWDFLEFKGRKDLFKKVISSGAKRRDNQK
ncbi:MAG: type II restriction endonuclease [Candidatus Kapaibacterium sp.]